MAAPVFECGLYQHYKGSFYHAYKLCRHSEHVGDPDEWMVDYAALEGDGSRWVRPLRMWHEEVKTETYSGPRFKKFSVEAWAELEKAKEAKNEH